MSSCKGQDGPNSGMPNAATLFSGDLPASSASWIVKEKIGFMDGPVLSFKVYLIFWVPTFQKKK